MDTLMLFYNIHLCMISYKAKHIYIIHNNTIHHQLIVENTDIKTLTNTHPYVKHC